MQQMVRIDTVDDVHMVAFIAQRVRKPIDVGRVSSEAVRRIERRQMKEIQRPRGTSAHWR